MNEKLFDYIDYDIYYDGFLMTLEEVCNLLNSLFQQDEALKDENEQLRQQIEQLRLVIDDLASHTSCDDLKKENEQLRKDLNCLFRIMEDTPIEHSLYVKEIKKRWEK